MIPARVRDSIGLTAAVWLAALIVAAALLAATGYRTRDPDSRAYVAITTRLVDEPASRWIAPQWWGAWGSSGLFREHPAGTFIPPALLARAGYPVAQAPFVMTLACQIVSLLLLAGLAARVTPTPQARALAWALQLIPIAFVFRVRANQEYLLLAGLMLVVYGIERSRANPMWIAFAIAGGIYAFLVKGVFALLGLVLSALWLFCRRQAVRAERGGWSGLAVTAMTMAAAAWGYEMAYRVVTGESFFAYYFGPRMALQGGAAGPLASVGDKVGNVIWYAGRVLWYAAPWSLVLMAAAVPRNRAASDAAPVWIRFATLAAVVTILLVAMRDIPADRYVFPAYFLAASAGVVFACGRWPRVAGLAEALDRTWPWGPAALWLLLVGIRALT